MSTAKGIYDESKVSTPVTKDQKMKRKRKWKLHTLSEKTEKKRLRRRRKRNPSSTLTGTFEVRSGTVCLGQFLDGKMTPVNSKAPFKSGSPSFETEDGRW